MSQQEILDKIEPLISTKKVNLYRKNREDLTWLESYKLELFDLDNAISNLSFGFWTNLFHRPYARIWKQNKTRMSHRHTGGVPHKRGARLVTRCRIPKG